MPPALNGINGALYKDFSLRIEQGSIVTIMGASGAGKSTLGRIMAGIVTPQKGIVRRSPDFTRPSDLVYVDQHPMNGVFPWQTVLENVRYPLEKLRWEGRERRDRICYLMNLVPAERAFRCLSGAAFRRRVTALGAFPLPLLETETGDSG